MENVGTQRRGPGTGALTGTVLAGRYRLAHVVSSGANTVIMDAIDLEADGPVTVKVVRPEHAQDPMFRRKFRRLAEISNALTHPNIASVTDWGEIELRGESTVFWTVDALGGGSLRDLLDRGRLLSPGQALVLGLEACRALDAAHHKGLYHTELTPSKMVFGVDRRLRVVDFGMARLLAEPAWADAPTVPTHVARYASPEQALGLPIDSKTDVYALALVVVEAVTGSVPFAADSTVATLAGRIDRLLPVSADLGSLASVLERAGRPESADRFSAAEFGRALVKAAPRLPKPKPIPILASGTFDTATMRRPTDPTGGVERPAPVAGLAGVDERGRTRPSTDEDPSQDSVSAKTDTPPDTSDDTTLSGAAAAAAAAVVAGGAAAAVGSVSNALGAETTSGAGAAGTVPPPPDDPRGDDPGRRLEDSTERRDDDDPAVPPSDDSAEAADDDARAEDAADDAAEFTGDAGDVGAEDADELATAVEVAHDAVDASDAVDAMADDDAGAGAADAAVGTGAAGGADDARDDDPGAQPTSDFGTVEDDGSAATTAPAGAATFAASPSDLGHPTLAQPSVDETVVDEADVDSIESGYSDADQIDVETSEPATSVFDDADEQSDDDIVDEERDNREAAPTGELDDTTVMVELASTTPTVAAARPTSVMPAIDPNDANDANGSTAVVGGTSELFDDAPTRRRRGPIVVLILLLVAGLAALGYAGSILLQTKSFEVPVLAGVPESQALSQIGGNGWDIEEQRERSDSFPEPDTVIRTTPGAGIELDEGETFTLVLSDGPEFRTLPDLDGLPFNTAVTELASLSLNGTESSAREFSETVPVDSVISWQVQGDEGGELQAGGQILPNETITMTLSKGPEPRTVPELSGETPDAARAALDELQLTYEREARVFSDTVPKGQILSQTPTAGEQVERDTTVRVQVSKGPDVVAFPDLDGLKFKKAQKLLIDTGLAVGSLLGTTEGTFVEATVDGSDVPVGEELRRGTVVDVIFL